MLERMSEDRLEEIEENNNRYRLRGESARSRYYEEWLWPESLTLELIKEIKKAREAEKRLTKENLVLKKRIQDLESKAAQKS